MINDTASREMSVHISKGQSTLNETKYFLHKKIYFGCCEPSRDEIPLENTIRANAY